MKLFALAARNLLRNGRRSALTILAVSLTLSLAVFINNFSVGMYNQMVDDGIKSIAGHVVVQHELTATDPDTDHVITGASSLADQLAAAFPNRPITRRATAAGLVTSTSNTVGVAILGIEPLAEDAAAGMSEDLLEGEWLSDRRALMIGDDLAEVLDVELGDKLVVMAEDPSGEMASLLFRVRGIYHSGAQSLDAFAVIGHVDEVKQLLPGQDAATQVALHLENTSQTESAKARVAGLVDNGVVLSWEEAMPDLMTFIKIDAQYRDYMFIVIGIMVAIGVLNTVLMSVMERIREFGVMLSIGMRPRQVAAMILYEGLVLGLISAVLGCLLGMAFTYPLIDNALDMSGALGDSYETAGVAMSSQLRATWDWVGMLWNALGAITLVVLASLYPAWQVTRLRPVEAMNHQ